MSSTRRTSSALEAALLPPGAGATFVATRHAGLARIEPLTIAGEQWLRDTVTEDATWDGAAVMIEMRYFPDLADAIIAAGFCFERNTPPN